MKKISLFIILIVLVSSQVNSKTWNVLKIAEYEQTNSNSIAIDSQKQIVFLGSDKDIYVIDASNSNELKLINTINVKKDVECIRFFNNNLYVADSKGQLYIYNTSDINNIKEIVKKYKCSASDFYVHDNYLFVLDGRFWPDEWTGLVVLDISNPDNIKQISSYKTKGNNDNSLFILDNYAYITDYYEGLWVLDISNLSDINLKGFYYTNDQLWDIYVSGKNAFITGIESGLLILDVLDIENIHKNGEYPYLESARGIYISGSYAYIADSTNGLRIYDVNQLDNLVETGYYETNNQAWDIILSDSKIYLLEKDFGFSVLKFEGVPLKADFESSDREGRCPLTVEFYDRSKGIIDNWLWDFGDSFTSNEQNPTHIYTSPGIYTVSLSVTGQGAPDSEIKEDYISVKESSPAAEFVSYTVTGKAPFKADFYDMSKGNIEKWLWNFGDGEQSREQNPDHIYKKAGTYTVSLTVWGPGGLGSIEKIAYIIVNNKISLEKIWKNTNSKAIAIDPKRKILFSASNDIIHFLNYKESLPENDSVYKNSRLFQKSNFVEQSKIELKDVNSLLYKNNILYAGTNNGLSIFDISNLSKPELIKTINTKNTVTDIFIWENYIVISIDSWGIRIYDKTDINDIKETGFKRTSGQACSICVKENILYVADGDKGLLVLNIKNPKEPVNIVSISDFENALSIHIKDNYLFVAAQDQGLRIFDISNLEKPKQINVFLPQSGIINATDIFVSGYYGYIADKDSGLIVINIANISDISELDYFHTAGKALQVIASGPDIFVANDISGVISLCFLELNKLSIKAIEIVNEGSGLLENAGEVSVDYIIDNDLNVFLNTDNKDLISLPVFVTIPSGYSSTSFSITVGDDKLLNTNKVNISASSPGWYSCNTLITVKDNEVLKTFTPKGSYPIEIPDYNKDGIFSEFHSITPGKIIDINLKIKLTHNYLSDLTAKLISPDRVCVKIFENIGKRGKLEFEITLDDEAYTPIQSAIAPYTETSYKPMESFKIFEDKKLSGIWKLQVVDDVRTDSGKLEFWQLEILYSSYENDAPYANEDYTLVNSSKPKKIDVLKNDYDINNDKIHVKSILEPPLFGDVEINPDSTITYILKDLSFENDKFIYELSDGKGSSEGTVNIYLGSIINCNKSEDFDIDNAFKVDSSIDCNFNGILQDINVKINLSHKNVSNLVIDLISPLNTSVKLVDRIKENSNSNDFFDTIFDDEAKTSINFGHSPFNDSYKPVERLSIFNNNNVFGKWVLNVKDEVKMYGGTLNNWAIEIRYQHINNKESIINNHIVNQHINENNFLNYLKYDLPRKNNILPDTNSFELQKNSFKYFSFIEIPPYGNRIKNIKAIINKELSHDNYFVIVFIHNNKWLLRPSNENFITYINSDNTFECDITKDADDYKASKIWLFLMPVNSLELVNEKIINNLQNSLDYMHLLDYLLNNAVSDIKINRSDQFPIGSIQQQLGE